MAHHITHSNIHFKWSRNLTPALTVPSGAEVTFDLRDGGNNQITPANHAQPGLLDALDFARMDPGFGPVAIEGAEPGDVLRIDILHLLPGDYGWTAILRGFGLLADDFANEAPLVKMWDLRPTLSSSSSTSSSSPPLPPPPSSSSGSSGQADPPTPTPTPPPRYAYFKPGIRIPVSPFLGIMGLAPPTDTDLPTIPPYDWGGNMDCRHLTVGATLWLPVQAPGALFSCGDGHAAQGDGEVCGTAIETPMRARLRLTLEKKGSRPWVTSPHYQTPSSPSSASPPSPEYAAMGLDPDLHEATRKAVRAAIAWLVAEKDLSRSEAYMLCSVAADLRIVQAVDMPNYGVVCSIPLTIFVDENEE